MPTNRTFVRWSGLLIILGSILWLWVGVGIGSLPVYIPGGPYRNTERFMVAVVLSLFLIILGSSGLHVHQHENSGKLGRVGWFASLGGVVLLGCSLLLPAALQDSILMPILVIPGMLSIVIGMVLTGIALIRRKLQPLWIGGLVLLGGLLPLMFNDQFGAVWTITPFGVVWLIIGAYVLVKGLATQHRPLVQ